jgi:hypothetical protein
MLLCPVDGDADIVLVLEFGAEQRGAATWTAYANVAEGWVPEHRVIQTPLTDFGFLLDGPRHGFSPDCMAASITASHWPHGVDNIFLCSQTLEVIFSHRYRSASRLS